MDFTMSDNQKEWLNRVQSFMTKHVRPAVPVYKQQDAEGPRWPAQASRSTGTRGSCTGWAWRAVSAKSAG